MPQGVLYKWIVSDEYGGTGAEARHGAGAPKDPRDATLLAFLLAKFPGKGRNKVKAFLTHQQVRVNGRVVTWHAHVLHDGDRITIDRVGGTLERTLGIQILYEDDSLIVIDKPAGLLSIATEKDRENTAYHVLMDHVRRDNPHTRVFVVHRLDQDTSGVMVFAKNEAAQRTLQDNWKDDMIERAYVAIVEGTVKPTSGSITSWLKESKTLTMYLTRPGEGMKAVLHYRVLKQNNRFTMLEVHLETGRKNQIRVQMQQLGHSVVGDKRYGSKINPLERLGLHAYVLSFYHPVTREVLRFESEVPASFLRLVSLQEGES